MLYNVFVYVWEIKEAESWWVTFRVAPSGADELIAGESHLRGEVRAELVWSEPNTVVIPVGDFLKTQHTTHKYWD